MPAELPRAKLDFDLIQLLEKITEDEYLPVVVRCLPQDTDTVAGRISARDGHVGHLVRAVGAVGAEVRADKIAALASEMMVQFIELDRQMSVATG